MIETGAERSLYAQVRRVSAAFFSRMNRQTDGVWAAPGRVNLIGEHTDYNDGFVLPIAIDCYAAVAIRLRRDGRVRLSSLQERDVIDVRRDELAPGSIQGWGAYPSAVVWALEHEGVDVPGFDLVVDGSVPIGAGLSSSAALECAVVTGLAQLTSADADAQRLALVAQRAEVEGVGMPCGPMDQMAAMLSRASHALFLDTRSLSFDHIPFDMAPRELALLVIDTRAPRRLIDGRYADRRAACETAARTLRVTALRDVSLERLDEAAAVLDPRLYRRVRHVVTEDTRVLEFVQSLHAGCWNVLGPLLTASHASLRDDFEVSSPQLDAAVDAALAAGALGARMTGAGFGGSAVALVPIALVAAVAKRVTTEFAARGFRAPEMMAVEPVDGARRAR